MRTRRTLLGVSASSGLVSIPRLLIGLLALEITGAMLSSPANADNKRFNFGVFANVYTLQHQAGCTSNIKVNPKLQLAAQWHTDDMMNNRTLDGDGGSDGSTPQDRANAAGYRGTASETVAINPSLAMNNLEVLNRWYYDPAAYAIMSNCANTDMGVWSANSLDRTVVVAVYGQPAGN